MDTFQSIPMQHWGLIPSTTLTCLRCFLNPSLTNAISSQSLGDKVKLCPYLHTHMNTLIIYTAIFLAGRLEVVWQSQLCGCFLLHINYFSEHHQHSLYPLTPKSRNPSNSLSFLPIRSAAHSVSSCFPADSTAVNGSYSQYGLMMGVSS